MARILVVDDEPDLCRLVSVMLGSEGHEVIEAGDVEEAQALLAEPPLPDLVLLDWMLPGLPGTRLLKDMKASQALRGIPVVMLTARSLVEQKEQAHMLGASGYLVKPFDSGQLRKAVIDALGPGS